MPAPGQPDNRCRCHCAANDPCLDPCHSAITAEDLLCGACREFAAAHPPGTCHCRGPLVTPGSGNRDYSIEAGPPPARRELYWDM